MTWIRTISNDEATGRLKSLYDCIRAPADDPAAVFEGRDLSAKVCARALTTTPAEMTHGDVSRLRDDGLDDCEILELNQVCAYFACANRTVLGLGINTDGEILGLSPGDGEDPDNWHHE